MQPPAAWLAAAFQNDAMFAFIEPDPVRRARVLPWFFAAACQLGAQHGRLDVDPAGGVAIWLVPGRPITPWAMVRCGLVLVPLRLGLPAFRRFRAITSAFEDAAAGAHPEQYWHGFILGVTPEAQGQGVGSRLAAPVLAEADAAGQACYLETTEERNLPLYERLGFATVVDEHRDGLPHFWGMIRSPQRS